MTKKNRLYHMATDLKTLYEEKRKLEERIRLEEETLLDYVKTDYRAYVGMKPNKKNLTEGQSEFKR